MTFEELRSPSQQFIPTIRDFFEPIIEQIQGISAKEGDKEREKFLQQDPSLIWRALRLLARQSPYFFVHNTQTVPSMAQFLVSTCEKIRKEYAAAAAVTAAANTATAAAASSLAAASTPPPVSSTTNTEEEEEDTTMDDEPLENPPSAGETAQTDPENDDDTTTTTSTTGVSSIPKVDEDDDDDNRERRFASIKRTGN